MRQKFQYEDLGLVFAPVKEFDYLNYSQVPTPVLFSRDIIRIYLAGRDDKNETFIYSVDVASDDPTQILNIHPDPVLGPGKLGCFDENGTMPSCAFLDNNIGRLFYSGWSVRKTVPYNNLTGCSVSEGFKKFENIAS